VKEMILILRIYLNNVAPYTLRTVLFIFIKHIFRIHFKHTLGVYSFQILMDIEYHMTMSFILPVCNIQNLGS